MSLFPDPKTFISFGPLSITWYAVCIMAGALATTYFGYRDLKKNGYNFETASDLLTGCLLFGIVGARLWYCAFYNLKYYLANPLQILNIMGGGLAIQGGLVAGAIFVFVYCYRRKMNFVRMGDCIAPHILLAQVFGRWGNFVNQEAYGTVVSASFYNGWPKFISDQMFINGAYRLPTFFMESVGCLIGWLLIVFVYKKFVNYKRGDLIYAYLVWYGAIRFYIEGFRTDSLMIGPLRSAQVTSVIFMIVGFMGLFGLLRKLVKNPKPVILLDLDGTIVDSQPAVLESFTYIFEKYGNGRVFDEQKQKEVIGPTLESMFKKYFPDEDTNKLISDYREHNRAIHPDKVTPIHNAKRLLAYLKDNDYKVAVVSNKTEEMCRFGLEVSGLDQYVSVIIGGDEVVNPKPNPEGIFKACTELNVGHDSCVYIGDSPSDIKAGKNAGAYTIGYVYSEDRRANLEAEKPNNLITDLKEVVNILEEDKLWTYNMK